ncbi:MAG: DUF4440 domain-containing protein [Aliifodinibius sp.]|nr:DUF4440 domain-containing protein [Fodinibius sp.]NIY28155.1 DUF4440 domain-containing protein [Fodinibius sp.]
MSIRFPFAVLCFAIFFHCTGSSESGGLSEDARAIKGAYAEWVKSTNAKDIESWSSFLAPSAVFLPPGNPLLGTNEEIVAYYVELFNDPNFSLECEQTFVQVAESRDMAWARGTCQAKFTSPDGKIGSGSSKWTKVWVRLDDGKWKCKLNTWNYNEED